MKLVLNTAVAHKMLDERLEAVRNGTVRSKMQ